MSAANISSACADFRWRLFSAFALPGVLITRSLPYGPLALALDVAICLLVIGALRSPIVPALSAGVLPLAHHWATNSDWVRALQTFSGAWHRSRSTLIVVLLVMVGGSSALDRGGWRLTIQPS